MRFPHTASVERLGEVNGKYIFQPLGVIKCNLQPISETDSQLYGINWTKGSVAYTPISSDVEEGDRLTINGKKYGVRGDTTRDYGSVRMQHKKLIVER